MTARLGGLSTAFARCVGELGMWSAARLFVSTARAQGGEPAIDQLRDALAKDYPLLDHVSLAPPEQVPGLADVVALCRGLKQLVVVGLESDPLAELVERLDPAIRIVLIPDTTFPSDVERIRAAWGGRTEFGDLDSFQRHAGTRSALLTFVYGADEYDATVARVWVRLYGTDVRTQFRSLIGWNLIGPRLERHPRWLVQTRPRDFTDVVGAPA